MGDKDWNQRLMLQDDESKEVVTLYMQQASELSHQVEFTFSKRNTVIASGCFDFHERLVRIVVDKIQDGYETGDIETVKLALVL